jgi:type VI secretion system protein VasD
MNKLSGKGRGSTGSKALAAMVVATLILQGCAGGAASAIGLAANVALQAAGLKDKGPPAPKMIPLRIHAGYNLNSDDEGHGFAVVARVYKLRDAGAFMSAPQTIFGNQAREREAMGDSLLEVREVVLTPGQRLESSERMTSEMAYLGVVILFRSPNGVTIGAHGCAISITEGKVYGMNASQAALLSPVACRGSQTDLVTGTSLNPPSALPHN